ncbi:MAG: hypothetical protein KAR06_02965 [Deltaproteobacteria bacterium]|nr:hypothetical protein [Deltaproteobacteria bacterium]
MVAELDKIPAILSEAEEIEHHLHNRERWFGLAAVPSGTHFGDEAILTPYVAISGAGVFGADANDEANVMGTDDTPAIGGMTKYDLHRILVCDVDNAAPWVLRVIYGTGTMADAEGAGQYTDVMLLFAAGPNDVGAPVNIIMPRLDCGVDKVWIRAKNANNNDTICFFVGLHEYEE